MPDPGLIRIYYEGDDDRAVLEGLQSLKLLPYRIEVSPEAKGLGGFPGMLQKLAPFISPIGGAGKCAIAIADLDKHSVAKMRSSFQSDLEKELAGQGAFVSAVTDRPSLPRTSLFRISGGGKSTLLALIGVGLAEDVDLQRRYQIEQYSMDDYILRMVSDQALYEASKDLRRVPYEKALSKLNEFVDILKRNQIPIEKSKRILHLLRAIADLPASPARFIQRLLSGAGGDLPPEALRKIFSPLLEDIEEALGLVSS